MVCQRWRSLIAWLQPVLAKVRCRISESSTLCVRRHLPRASQPQYTSELLEQQRLLAGRIADGLQGRGFPPLHSLTGLLGWDQTGSKDISYPSSTLQRHKHNPHQFTHCLLSLQATVTLPSFICWRRRHSKFVASQHPSLGQSDGGRPGSLQLALLSFRSTHTHLALPLLSAQLGHSGGTEKAHVPANTSLVPSRAAGEGCLGLWGCFFGFFFFVGLE